MNVETVQESSALIAESILTNIEHPKYYHRFFRYNQLFKMLLRMEITFLQRILEVLLAQGQQELDQNLTYRELVPFSRTKFA